MQPNKLVDVNLEHFCFCECHGDVLERPDGRAMPMHYGVHLANALERELACARCAPAHQPPEEPDHEAWRASLTP